MLLKLQNIDFSYDGRKKVFEDFNFELQSGTITAVAGESGCGKTSLLQLIYGLLNWQKGEIIFDGKRLHGPKGNLVPGEAMMKMVAQHYDLMPYATVLENTGKFLSNINLAEKKRKSAELLKAIGMTEFAAEYPKNLSGGQQQRVAIARALSVQPKLLLLDEPFSHLDEARKSDLRESLFTYAKNNQITVLISSHEVSELMPWLDEVAVMKDGKIAQRNTPERIFRNPASAYVAQLFGEVNILDGQSQERFRLQKQFFYPTEIVIADMGWPSQVIESRFAGNYYRNKIKTGEHELIVYSDRQLAGDIFINFLQ